MTIREPDDFTIEFVAAPAHLAALTAAKPRNDPRRSLGWPSTKGNPGDSLCRGHRNSHLHLSQRF